MVSKGKWVEKKYWSCTSGARSTPTPKGHLYGKSQRACLWTRIYLLVLHASFMETIYSIPFCITLEAKTKIQDGRLGINASHGCIRLTLTNAKWIYDNIPRGTKVVIY